MKNLKHDLGLRIVKLIDVLLVTIPFAMCWYMYYSPRIESPFLWRGNALIVFLFVVLFFAYARIYDAFLVSLNRISEMIYSQALAIIISDGIMYIILWILTEHIPNILPALMALAAQLLFAAIWSFTAHKWYFANFPPKLSAVIYGEREGMESLIGEYGLERKFSIQNVVDINDCKDDLSILDGIEAVFISGIHSNDRNRILKYCVENSILVYVIPRVGDTIMSGARPVHMLHLPVLRVGRYSPAPEFLFVKRLFDIVSSSIALIVTSPVMLVTAIAIKAHDGGPVFYKQCRLTKDRKEFDVLKFRSMRVDAEKNGVARLSTGDNDDRITPVGRFIRKVRIDELPQLINVLKGDMSVVGPRPERPEIAAQYEAEMPEFALRLQAKAGLTGYAQVFGKYNTTPYDKLQMDLMYIAQPKLSEELRIIFATVKILFMPESTEGVTEGQTTAASTKQVEHDESVLNGETADERINITEMSLEI